MSRFSRRLGDCGARLSRCAIVHTGSIRHSLLRRCQKEKHHQPYDLPVPLHIQYAL